MDRYCPRCTYPLTPSLKGDVELDHCRRCRGNFFDVGETGKIFGPYTNPEQWVESHVATYLGRSKLHCPAGHKNLQAYRFSIEKIEVEIDIFPKCQGIWLDASEGKQLRDILWAEQ